MRWPTAGWSMGSRTVWASVTQCIAEWKEVIQWEVR